jgi:YidC/Oxa1 family membrane protein insertase
MDRNSVLAIILITVIILLLPAYYDLVSDKETSAPVENYSETSSDKTENISKEIKQPEPVSSIENNEKSQPDAIVSTNTVKENRKFVVSESDSEKVVEIITPIIEAKISSMGGGNFINWRLMEYGTWQNERVSIINEEFDNGLKLSFQSEEGDFIDLNQYNFEVEISNKKYVLAENDKMSIRFFLEIKESTIEKIYTFYGAAYHVDLQIKISNAQNLLLNNEYQFGWYGGLPSNELNIVEDYTYSEAYANMGGEFESYEISNEGEADPIDYNGNIDWIALRMKYFLAAVVPQKIKTTGVSYSGEGVKSAKTVLRKYNTFINAETGENDMDHRYQIYMGPMNYSILSEYDNNLDDLVMNHGWYERTFRPISLLILAIFNFFKTFIPNYGVIIILFSIIVKIVVYPLTKKSYRSMKEMSKLQPLMAELKEKYKGDPQRYQKETMKLYKEHKINPLGGCVPVLLQLPLLGALFIVFRSTIQLRGASFIPGWIDDLSRGDTLATLPFSLPMYGDQFNLLPILMAVSMIFQSKMTMQDPKQKAMVYIMPIFLLLLFNQFPSGLNLYYTMFNVLTIIQQKFIDGGKSEKPADKKTAPAKPGKKK